VKPEKLFRLDEKWFWVICFLCLLPLEMMFRLKLGVIFFMCFGWILIIDYGAERFFGTSLGPGPVIKFVKTFYYSTMVSVLIFLVLSFLNIVFRSFNNNWNFFQLP